MCLTRLLCTLEYMSSAGTSANVVIVIYGAELNTGECVLAETKTKKKGCFERGSSDQFVKEVGTCFISRFTTTQISNAVKMSWNTTIRERYVNRAFKTTIGKKLPNVLNFELFKA